ncbi:c-type cytochrome [Bordetella genomosp. 11]|uniref:Cytochrome c domain-containing protein n=1 Tax=Bordetella genomosp. 11 TaxID=1416808 RepID=A0A261UHE1_9BORD|nr:c-type cytochrome [Bordetella genomosp. 11]OZI60640.1 hypothetical protein CAL28_14685 [Bordetella genomosp. 11]
MSVRWLGAPAVLASLALLSWPAAGNAQALGGDRLFRQRCASCHSIEPARNAIGPSLFGVFGRRAGAMEGARYSGALQGSDVVWTKETLDRYLRNPRQAVPGTSMMVNVPNQAEREALVDYLGTLR